MKIKEAPGSTWSSHPVHTGAVLHPNLTKTVHHCLIPQEAIWSRRTRSNLDAGCTDSAWHSVFRRASNLLSAERNRRLLPCSLIISSCSTIPLKIKKRIYFGWQLLRWSMEHCIQEGI